MYLRPLLTAIFLAFSTISLFADPLVKVELGPVYHADASLIVVDMNGVETHYTPIMLENFTTYRLTTTTPWRETPADFEGVLLSEILAAHGLDNEPMIRVTAENDYTTTLEQDLLNDVPILVATRVNGRPHSRRLRGPIQFVIDSETFAESQLTSESNFVWMAARIEAEN